MEHNTDRILWTVLVLAIGVALYVAFRPAANGLLNQTTEKIQTVAGGVKSNTSDNSSSNTDVGTNLIQMANTTVGYVNDNGTVIPTDSDWERVTDFIEVEPNQTYCIQYKADLVSGQYSWVGVGVYDGNKTFITRPSFAGTEATGNITDFKKWTMVTPNNAKYVRVIFSTHGNAKVKFEKGGVATP